MKRKKNFLSADLMLIVLLVFCTALAVTVCVLKPAFIPAIAIAAVLIILFALICVRHLRRGLRKLLNGSATAQAASDSGLAKLQLPIVALSNKRIVWYNNGFLKNIADGTDSMLLPINKLLPGLDLIAAAEENGQNLEIDKQHFMAYSTKTSSAENLHFVVLMDSTVLKRRASEYLATRPSVLYISIDTYDEIIKEMRESQRAEVITELDRALERYIGRTSGFLRKISSSRYVAVVEERHMQEMVENRFGILDTVRKTDEDGATPVSLSIGVGRLGGTLREGEEMARQALEMALGRGGDQAALKGPDGFEFYGGITRSVEKRTKVKSRLVAMAIKDLMNQYERVLIMGHKSSDMDCVGASIGMLRFCKICKIPAKIVIDQARTVAGSMVRELNKSGYGGDMLSPEEAMPLANNKTLLVIVDTHMKHLIESEDIYSVCGAVVVIDHHRRMVGHIDNAVILHHEPYASSASELVSELLQYIGGTKEERLTPLEAEALLAGIMLDTRTFSLHVGVRTFEAAAYLRRMGAQTAATKKLFSTSKDEYLYKCHLVAEAKIKHNCAVVVSDKVPHEYEIVAPQAANELLSIDGVIASFVAIKQGEQIRISGRSMGEVNVQLVLEKLGGGGHQTMAGAQLKDVSIEEAEKRILAAIEKYYEENINTNTNANG